MNLLELTDKICNDNYKITKEEALELYDWPDLNQLCSGADRIREVFCKDGASICSIINAKQGGCSEDCKYCAQSAHWKTSCVRQDMISKEKAVDICKKALDNNVSRISLVTAGRGTKGKDFDHIIECFKDIQEKTGNKMRTCASLGIIEPSCMVRLKEAGVVRYHHNLETGRNFYPNICTTHTYDERVATIKAARAAGLSSCSGGIIGMGESRADRIDMAFELRELGVESVPVNVLSPIKGTPFENNEPISREEILRTIAVFRYILTSFVIRCAAGRKALGENGVDAFKSGANGLITGDFLTLEGSDCTEDFEMISSLGMQSGL